MCMCAGGGCAERSRDGDKVASRSLYRDWAGIDAYYTCTTSGSRKVVSASSSDRYSVRSVVGCLGKAFEESIGSEEEVTKGHADTERRRIVPDQETRLPCAWWKVRPIQVFSKALMFCRPGCGIQILLHSRSLWKVGEWGDPMLLNAFEALVRMAGLIIKHKILKRRCKFRSNDLDLTIIRTESFRFGVVSPSKPGYNFSDFFDFSENFRSRNIQNLVRIGHQHRHSQDAESFWMRSGRGYGGRGSRVEKKNLFEEPWVIVVILTQMYKIYDS
jgi:hypothetical protein